MEPTPARYEWRIWADHLDEVAMRLRDGFEPGDIRESTEIYIVAADRDDMNVKVRDGQLDVKRLLATRDGFERWEPQLKATFPVSADVVDDVLSAALAGAPVALERERYTLEQFTGEVVARHADLRAVTVEKQRRAYTLAGCLAEIADVTIAGRSRQTAAVESADLAALREARDLAGLAGHANLSYPVIINRMLGAPND